MPFGARRGTMKETYPEKATTRALPWNSRPPSTTRRRPTRVGSPPPQAREHERSGRGKLSSGTGAVRRPMPCPARPGPGGAIEEPTRERVEGSGWPWRPSASSRRTASHRDPSAVIPLIELGAFPNPPPSRLNYYRVGVP